MVTANAMRIHTKAAFGKRTNLVPRARGFSVLTKRFADSKRTLLFALVKRAPVGRVSWHAQNSLANFSTLLWEKPCVKLYDNEAWLCSLFSKKNLPQLLIKRPASNSKAVAKGICYRRKRLSYFIAKEITREINSPGRPNSYEWTDKRGARFILNLKS